MTLSAFFNRLRIATNFDLLGVHSVWYSYYHSPSWAPQRVYEAWPSCRYISNDMATMSNTGEMSSISDRSVNGFAESQIDSGNVILIQWQQLHRQPWFALVIYDHLSNFTSASSPIYDLRRWIIRRLISRPATCIVRLSLSLSSIPIHVHVHLNE